MFAALDILGFSKSPNIQPVARSATIAAGTLVLPDMTVGMMGASSLAYGLPGEVCAYIPDFALVLSPKMLLEPLKGSTTGLVKVLLVRRKVATLHNHQFFRLQRNIVGTQCQV